MGTRTDIIYVSCIPWKGSWHRQQDMMSYMAKQGYRVLYVEPSSKKHPFQKLYQKVLDNIWTIRSIGLPYERCLRSVHFINSILSRREINRVTRLLGFQDPIIWVDRVHGFDFHFYQKNRFVIYDLIDEIRAFGRFRNEKMLLELENSVLKRADLLVSSSRILLERKIRQSNRTGESMFLPNGVDVSRFTEKAEESDEQKEHPILGFVGEISKRRLNYRLIQEIAKLRTDWHFIFIGPGNPTDKEELKQLSGNIQVMNAVEGDHISSIISSFDIGIIPYRTEKEDMDYIFPRKAFEYLAAGKAVISTPLREIKDFYPYIAEAETAKQFIEKTEEAFTQTNITAEDRKKFAEQFDWNNLMNELLLHLK